MAKSTELAMVPKTKKSKKKPPARPWNFPKNTLEDAINIPRAIEAKNAGNPLPSPELARVVGFKRSEDWRFQDVLKSANLYGLVSGSGAKVTVALEQIGSDIVSPSSPEQRQKAIQRAFANVELFKEVRAFYKDKPLPEDEFFANTLVRQFKLDRERIDTFISVFTANLRYVQAFGAEPRAEPVSQPEVGETVADRPRTPRQHLVDAPARREGRTFLDSCFVLMPFGNWYDVYFREIYDPAIRTAGLEPLRADSLFSTGSVMEQIWDEIRKSSVLLAELTDKNANVFYELGLAHAIAKPVVIITGNLDDVPFDLRHLRVIVYNVREPNWANVLKGKITDYLRNTKSDPSKSIPQPFREMITKNGESDDGDT